MKNIIVLFAFCLFCLKLVGQTDKIYSLPEIQDSVYRQHMIFPQEKIHLHLDRDYYIPGEKIWFKAYVTDVLTYQFPTYSRYVYVELINSADSLVNRVLIRQGEDGMYYGNIFVSDIVPEGYYTVRAYTRYMENLGDDYFFKKNVYIGMLPTTEGQNKKRKEKKKQSNVDYEVSFFPEGGCLVAGEFCKVAFKALDINGNSEYISGEIVNEKGDYVCSVETIHAGMGSFIFIVEQDKDYFLKCKNRNGKEKRFKLPPAQPAYSIRAVFRNKNHFISLKKAAGLSEIPLYILIHCSGVVCYFDAWDWQRNLLMFSQDQFPVGVTQIVLFDKDMNPLSERLIFNKNEEQVKLVYTTDKSGYQTREKITSSICVMDKEGIPLTGHVSVAVTDDKDLAIDSLTTIASSLLLSSELRGYIESPAYYLQDNRHSEIALDHLMMTHGWRRYNIPEVIKGNMEYPETGFEKMKKVSGTVKSLFLGKPEINGEVVFFSSDGTVAQVQTDSSGRFGFYGFDYPDSTSFFIQARNWKGRKKVELLLDEEDFPVLKCIPDRRSDYFVTNHKGVNIAEKGGMKENTFMKKAEQRAQYDEDLRMIHLKEVEVKTWVIEKKDEARLQFWANKSSDITIYREQIEKRHPLLITDLLYNVAGVRVTSDGKICIRGESSLIGKTDPLVLVDGIPIEWPDKMSSIYDSPLESVNVFDVESIDIFKGPSTAIFGMRGGSGVISITTKRGSSSDYKEDYSFNYVSINPLGYQKPVEFYSPKYDTPAAKSLSNPDYRTTLFWKPDVVLSEEGKASFEFYSSDFPTTYSVVIEGLSTDGKIIRQIEKIIVE